MATPEFTQSRADAIVAALLGSDLNSFVDAVAFAQGVTPTAEAFGKLGLPADLSIDASSFSPLADGSASVLASGAGDSHPLRVIVASGEWKLDSTGSNQNIVQAR